MDSEGKERVKSLGSHASPVRTVYIAGPFYSLVDPATGRMSDANQRKVERLIGFFEARGCRVFNAHKREQWGQAFLDPDEFTRLDFEEVLQSDLVVANPGSPASTGTHVEIGWASALGKPIVLLLQRGMGYAGLVVGLGSFAAVEVLESEDEVEFDSLEVAVERVVDRARLRPLNPLTLGSSNAPIFSISGPSGVGKTTVIDLLTHSSSRLTRVRLVSSRQPRTSNQDDGHFRFVTREECTTLKERGDLAALASTYGDELYGVEHTALREACANGIGVVDLGLANLRQVRRSYQLVSILLLPPSLDENIRRIAARATEEEAEVARRVGSAADVLLAASEFDYVLTNHDSGQTAARISEIVNWETAKYLGNQAGRDLACEQWRQIAESPFGT